MKNKTNTKTKKVLPKKTSKKPSGTYVDGFVLKISKSSLNEYKKLTAIASKVWMEYGALQYVETIGDDLNIKMGIPFAKLTNAKKDELVVFSWIVYKSKADRDAINKKVMKDKRLACDPSKMPFDCNEMTYGGFKIIESA